MSRPTRGAHGTRARRGRWWLPRLVFTLSLLLAAIALARYEHVRPDAWRILLVIGVGVCVVALVVDLTTVAAPDWDVVPTVNLRPAGQDPGLSRNVRILENHLTSRTVDPVLHHRLRTLTTARLSELGLRRDAPGVDERLGPTLCQVLDGDPRRLDRGTLEECIRRIEEL
jgi:hypothetical protein